LEVPHEEAHGEVRGDRRTRGADRGGPTHAVALRARQGGQLQNGGRADDRRREEEGKAGSILVREPDEEPAAHRRARSGEARDERDRLRRADENRVAPSHRARDAGVVVGIGHGRPPAEQLRPVEEEPVERQEDRRVLRRPEEVAQLVLQREAEDARGDRADDEQLPELRVGVAGRDLTIPERPAEAFADPPPVAPEEPEQDDCRREMRRDEEGEEVRILLVNVPTDELRKDDAMAEARDGKELGNALEKAEHRPLEVADRHYVVRARFGPVLNQANARQASPTRNDAMPCFVWWWLDPA